MRASTEAIERFLLHELHRQALGRFGRTRSATVSVQLKMLESRLSAFAEWQASNHRDGWRISYTEQDLLCDDFTDIHDRPVKLMGASTGSTVIIARGHWRVLDYKTSENAECPQTNTSQQGGMGRSATAAVSAAGPVTEDYEERALGYIQLPGDLQKCRNCHWRNGATPNCRKPKTWLAL